MRVLFAGQTGVQKGQVIERLASHARAQNKVPDDPEMAERFALCLSVEDEIRRDGDFTGFLNQYSERAQSDRWRVAFERILKRIQGRQPQHVLLSLHTVFQRHSRYFSPVDWKLLREFGPDVVVTLIDDLQSIAYRVRSREEEAPSASYFRLREIAAWRSAEILFADTLASHLLREKRLDNLVVAVKHPCATVYGLLFEPQRLRVYASFPITTTRAEPDSRAEIDAFRKALHERFVVFDPLTIDEKILELAFREQFGEDAATTPAQLAGKCVKIDEGSRWPIDAGNALCCDADGTYPMELDAADVREVVADVNNQIRWRDYRLISTAHCVAAYRPCRKGALSGGVQAELHYANVAAGVPTFVVFPREDGDPQESPFSDAGKICGTVEEIVDALEKHQRARNSE